MSDNSPRRPVEYGRYFRLTDEVYGFIGDCRRFIARFRADLERYRCSKKSLAADWVIMCASIVPVIAAGSLVLFAALIAATVLYMIATGRSGKLVYFAISSIFAVAWCSAAGNIYRYETNYPVVLGMNLWPLLCWSTAMFWGNINFFRLAERFRGRGFLRLLSANAVIHWFFLILCECLAYHVFGFVNIGTSGYPGLPVFDCIHGPRWMQAAYLLMEPACFATIYLAEQFGDIKRLFQWRSLFFVKMEFTAEEETS